jgi:hypothetical protein
MEGLPVTALNMYEQVILNCAAKYEVKNHWKLEFDELVSEGWLVFSQLCSKMDTEEEGFFYYFIRSVENHYTTLHRYRKAVFRCAVEIQLEDFHSDGKLSEIHVKLKLKHAKEMLSPEAYRVLHEMFYPSADLLSEVEADYLRAQHLKRRGVAVQVKFEVRNDDIKDHFDLYRKKFYSLLDEVRHFLKEDERAFAD